MEKQPKNETKTTVESTDPADGALSDKELDEVSGGDESPKESVTFNYGSLQYKYNQTGGD